MTRLVLAFLVSAVVLAVGVLAAWVQSKNFAKAAELDQMQGESEWFERRKSRLREAIERFEFEFDVEQTRLVDERTAGGGQ